MEIEEFIHEGVVEPSYKNPTRADAKMSGLITKMIVEAALSLN